MQFNSHDVKEKSRISGIVRSGLDQFRLASAEWSLVSGPSGSSHQTGPASSIGTLCESPPTHESFLFLPHHVHHFLLIVIEGLQKPEDCGVLTHKVLGSITIASHIEADARDSEQQNEAALARRSLNPGWAPSG